MKVNYVVIILYDKSYNFFEVWLLYVLELKFLENNFGFNWEIFICMYRCCKDLLLKIRYKVLNKLFINLIIIGYII